MYAKKAWVQNSFLWKINTNVASVCSVIATWCFIYRTTFVACDMCCELHSLLSSGRCMPWDASRLSGGVAVFEERSMKWSSSEERCHASTAQLSTSTRQSSAKDKKSSWIVTVVKHVAAVVLYDLFLRHELWLTQMRYRDFFFISLSIDHCDIELLRI